MTELQTEGREIKVYTHLARPHLCIRSMLSSVAAVSNVTTLSREAFLPSRRAMLASLFADCGCVLFVSIRLDLGIESTGGRSSLEKGDGNGSEGPRNIKAFSALLSKLWMTFDGSLPANRLTGDA